MKSDEPYLRHILDAIKHIESYIESIETFEKLEVHQMAQDALIRQFQVIGEASRLLSDKTRAELEAIEWFAIVGLRNRLVHEYFGIDLEVVWKVAHRDLPVLKTELLKFLESAFPSQ